MLKIYEKYGLDMAYNTCKRTFAQQYSYLCDEVAEEYKKVYAGELVSDDFQFSSNTNANWETVESLREKIRRYIDYNFKAK